MELFKTFVYDPLARESFISGKLREEWIKQYPMLFDEIAKDTSRNQIHYHYFEWQAAVNLFIEYGFYSLVEKYQFKSHKDQHQIFKDLVPLSVIQLLESRKYGRQQLPDLLVYRHDRSDWFFCEVKGNLDRERIKQNALFDEIQELTSKHVRLIKFINKKSSAIT
ncbi:MAG: hypothetical protein KBF64_04135 [Anaerolineaceae bacterium]|nr:hypothetical protein [Anaerolineaceae bacterium]